MKAYQPIVCQLIEKYRPSTILDVPSGNGWLRQAVQSPDIFIDGVDLYESYPAGYRKFLVRDLEDGIPEELGGYDMIISCEGIEHIANPGHFLRSAAAHLNPGGVLVVTTPNTWYPEARFKYLTTGFFPGFPSLAGRIARGTHMHILPWNWPQLYLHLSLAGFHEIELHSCTDENRTRVLERFLAIPMWVYCVRKARRSPSPEEQRYWSTCGSSAAVYARRLIVSARA